MSYKDTADKIKELRKQAEVEARAEFLNATKKIFEEYPKLESFSWPQYAPYFADGDECVFHVQADALECKYDGKEYEEGYKYEDGYDINECRELEPMLKEITKVLDTIDEDDFKEMFGNHVKVTVTRKGIETDEYEHD